ncbi:MAG: hypothetical protein AAFR61_32500 [Bacteroidota bacterium]
MKTIFSLWLLSLFSLSALFAQEEKMNNQTLGAIIAVLSDTVQGAPGGWEFTVNSVPMLCITDEVHNRMRIISPVREMKDVSEEQLKAAMEANFHTALDVKYAISNDILWVAFIHPLGELTKDQVVDAIKQVFFGNLTFGTTYTSTELNFPTQEERKEQQKERKKQEEKDKTSKS